MEATPLEFVSATAQPNKLVIHVHVHIPSPHASDVKTMRKKLKRFKQELRTMSETTNQIAEEVEGLKADAAASQSALDTLQANVDTRFAEFEVKIGELRGANPAEETKLRSILEDLRAAREEVKAFKADADSTTLREVPVDPAPVDPVVGISDDAEGGIGLGGR